jgi:hypothetical protein
MAEVTGDFGGTPIKLNNAATEATLKQLVTAIGILAAKSGKDIKNQKQLEAELKKFYNSLDKAGKNLGKLNKAQEEEIKKRKALADAIEDEEEKRKRAAAITEKSIAGVRNFTAAVENTIGKMTGMMSSLAGMGNSFTGAASAFNSLPLVGGVLGTVFGAIAQSGDRVYNSFREAASVGANFNGSIRDMVNAAGGAGLTIEQFTGIIKRNGESVALLGTGTQDGAKQLAKMGKMMRDSAVGDDLARLGYNTEQINEGMAKFGGMMVRTGKQMDQSSLVKISGDYLKNLAAVSELTGKNKDAMQAEADARMADSQYRLMLAKLDPEGAKNLELMMQSVPKAHQAGLKEIIATGTANSDQAIATMAYLNKTGQSALALGATMRETNTLTKDQVLAFDDVRRTEAKALAAEAKGRGGLLNTIGNFGDSVAQELTVGVLDTAAQTKDLRQALDDQGKGLKEAADKQKGAMDPASMKKFQEDIATLSNKFTMFLAQNMPMLMSAFDRLTTLVTNVLLPAFNFLMKHFEAIVAGLIAFKVILGATGIAMKAIEFYKMMKGPGSSTNPAHVIVRNPGALGGGGPEIDGDGKGKGGKGKFGKIGKFVKGAAVLSVVTEGMQLADDLGNIEENEKAGKITKAEVKEQKGAAYGGAAGGVGGALGGAAAGAAIGSVVPIVGTAIGGIVGGIAGAWLGRKGGEAAGKAVMSESKDQKAKAATGTPAGVVKAETKTAETTAPINYGANSEALLKQFANQENSPLVKEAQQKVAQAETARKEIEAKAQADAKAKEEATKKAEAEAKKEKEEKEKSIKTKPGQESPEVLLAQLNNNMAQMVKMQKSSFEVLEKQLGVQRSATGNLFAAV